MGGEILKLAAIFFIVSFSGCILITPLIDIVGAKILKEELNEALYHFVKENCNDEIEILSIDSPRYTPSYLFPVSKSWHAEVNSTDYYFYGEVSPRAARVTMSSNCNNLIESYQLSRIDNRFIENYGSIERDAAGGVITKKYLLNSVALCLSGALVLWAYKNRQKRSKKWYYDPGDDAHIR